MKNLAKAIMRLLLGAILIYASIGKVTNAGDFATALSNYRLLPSSLVLLGSLVIPWLEFILGLLLITGRWLSTVTFMTAVLFLIFTMAHAQAIVRGLDISCGCFELSDSGSKISSLTLFRNILLFSGALFIMTGPRDYVREPADH